MAKKLARTVSVPAITVESILATRISEIEKIPCECTSDTNELGEVVNNTCDRCKQLEKLRNKCVCGKCDDCLHILLEYHKTQQCKCTYKTIQVEETIINEQGLEEVILVDRDAVDVMCERCITILSIEKQLSDRDIMRKAYIDEVDFDKYEVVDDVIKNKVVESGTPSDIDVLKEAIDTEQLVQNFAIDTMMFEIIPGLESRLPQAMSLTMDENTKNINLMKGLVRDMGAYFADRIIREVVTYKQCFSITMYRKYQADTDAILRMEGHGHLIVPID